MWDGVEESRALSFCFICRFGFIVNTNELLVDRAGALIEKVRLVPSLVFPLHEDSPPPLQG